VNQAITVSAVPKPGQRFLNWSGAVSGTQSVISLTVTQDTTLIANFTQNPFLRVSEGGIEGWSEDGFRFTLFSEPQSSYQIWYSSNGLTWGSLGFLTNIFGEAQFTDSEALNNPFRIYKATR
jgi:hypothetical protein